MVDKTFSAPKEFGAYGTMYIEMHVPTPYVLVTVTLEHVKGQFLERVKNTNVTYTNIASEASARRNRVASLVNGIHGRYVGYFK